MLFSFSIMFCDDDTSLLTGLTMKLSYDIDSPDNRDEQVINRLSRILGPVLSRYFQADVRGLERIPSGPALYVGNHNAGFMTPDSFIFGLAVYEAGGLEALPYGLGHEVAISIPLFHQILMPLGAVRASHDNAHKLFRRGKKVLVYPGGDLDSMRPFRKRNQIIFGERRGYIKLVLREQVPIIPVVAAGAHETFIIIDDLQWLAKLLRFDKIFRVEVWPLTLSIPWGITLGPLPFYIPWPTRILIEIMEPITFPDSSPDRADDENYIQQCAEFVETAMQTTLDRLVKERLQRA